jgi:1-acyl-sn-glycerol-3-phosphate acyltransferase
VNPIKNRLLSAIAFETLSNYLRLSVSGTGNIPKRGPVIFISNHSGFSGLDALLLQYLIYKHSKNFPKILLHRLWYLTKSMGKAAGRLGFIEAKYANGVEALRRGESILLFPEGAHGNFKPYSKKYKLQDFKTGFLRMALECRCPVVPVIIVGPEESHINLKKIDMTGIFKDAALPVPLNVWPLPVKWKVSFLEPILPSDFTDPLEDPDFVPTQVNRIKTRLQTSIDQSLLERGHPFI